MEQIRDLIVDKKQVRGLPVRTSGHVIAKSISIRTLMVFKLNAAGEYGRPEMYGSRDKVSVPLLGDLVVDLAEVFAS